MLDLFTSTFLLISHFTELENMINFSSLTQLPVSSLALKRKQIKSFYFSPMNEKMNWFSPFKDAGVSDHITPLFRFLQLNKSLLDFCNSYPLSRAGVTCSMIRLKQQMFVFFFV